MYDFDQFSKIMSHLCTPGYGATISVIAEECHLPTEAVRRALAYVMCNPCLELNFYKNSSAPGAADTYDDDDSYDYTEKEYVTHILAGDLDGDLCELYLSSNSSEDAALLPLSALENSSVEAFGFDLGHYSKNSFFKKETASKIPEEDYAKQEFIQSCIHRKREISFRYRDKSLKIVREVSCIPILLITNTGNQEIYLKDSEGKIYLLSRIRGGSLKEGPKTDVTGAVDDANNKYVWSVSYSEPAPVHVKVCIATTVKNTLNKIKNDTAIRSETRRLYQKEGQDYWYYEDDVLGLSDFAKWLRSYGSAVIVLEPESLKEKMVKSAERVLHQYDAAKRWKL